MNNKHVDVSVEVERLIKAAADRGATADEALKFSQAACNSANAMAALALAKRQIKEQEE